jgi:hypothetical protein
MEDFTLRLTVEEQAALVRLLDTALGESRVEARRTHFSPEFREQVLAEEKQLAGLLKKLRQPVAS